MKPLQAVNDCVVRFANVNGSGSASANSLFARIVFRAGVAVNPVNIFPSNIQGLPTWYEVRISGAGYTGRRGGYDLMVAMNGRTLIQDYNDLVPGGYFLYDSAKALPPACTRDDIVPIGIPFTTICHEAFTDRRLRGLLRNTMYVGALACLLDIPKEHLADSIARQFAKKQVLADHNIQAMELGYDYAAEHFAGTCLLSVDCTRGACPDAIMMTGNTATALGALYAGATVVGWYPITPSTSVIEAFGKYAERYRRDPETGEIRAAIVQAEDELAAIGMVIGAAWNGARAFTATSGPGISLMSEFLGLAYFAEIPAVVIDVQRGGPSTGMPTRTQQSDLNICAYASHGDSKNILLFPANPNDCFTMTAQAFDLADRLQTPVLVLTDLHLGMNEHICASLDWDDSRRYDRGKVLTAEELEELESDKENKHGVRWGRYRDVDGDGICWRTLPGTHPEKGAYFTRGTSHDEYSAYTESSAAYVQNMERLQRKWQTAKAFMPKSILHTRHIPPCHSAGGAGQKIEQAQTKAAHAGLIFYGTTTPVALELLDIFTEHDYPLIGLQILSFPFSKEVEIFLEQHKHLIVLEQNRDHQMKTLLTNECDPKLFSDYALQTIACFHGLPPAAKELLPKVVELLSHQTDLDPLPDSLLSLAASLSPFDQGE